MSSTPRERATPILVAAVGTCAVALLGGLATQIGPWYRALNKPTWQPPDWAFGPAWTLIYTLTATAAVRAWRASPNRRSRAAVERAFAINGVLNVLWSVVFFTLRRPDWALVEVAFLWLSIIGLIYVAGRRDRASGFLLLPYLARVGFAGWLNLAVVRLNGPF